MGYNQIGCINNYLALGCHPVVPTMTHKTTGVYKHTYTQTKSEREIARERARARARDRQRETAREDENASVTFTMILTCWNRYAPPVLALDKLLRHKKAICEIDKDLNLKSHVCEIIILPRNKERNRKIE